MRRPFSLPFGHRRCHPHGWRHVCVSLYLLLSRARNRNIQYELPWLLEHFFSHNLQFQIFGSVTSRLAELNFGENYTIFEEDQFITLKILAEKAKTFHQRLAIPSRPQPLVIACGSCIKKCSMIETHPRQHTFQHMFHERQQRCCGCTTKTEFPVFFYLMGVTWLIR